MRVNEAYVRLKDPLKRAAYLCELNGAPIEAESNTAMPPGFLVQQLEWREALEEAGTSDASMRWQPRCESSDSALIARLETCSTRTTITLLRRVSCEP